MHYKILLAVSFLFLSFSTYAQNGVKVYGFYQEQTPGTIPVDPRTGRPVKAELPVEYQVYLTTPKGAAIQLRELWIKGQRYSFTSRSVKGPVTFRSPGTGREEVLVPASAVGLRQLLVSEKSVTGKTAKAPVAAGKNELIVVYTQNGVRKTATLKRLTRLEPIMYP